jgi:dTDP-4-amino-4,6-dideoxygalactose transaminase
LLGAVFAARAVTLCGSGTAALERGLRLGAAWRGQGTRVALPAYSCFDVATAAVGAKLPILLYDLDPATLGPDLDSLRRALAEGAGVVVVAPLYGMPVDWAAIETLATPAGALLIEDAAQGQGALWQGRPLGSLGQISVLSFGRGKGWTGGGGGALLLRLAAGDEHDAPALDPPSNRAVLLPAAVQWALGRPACYGLPAAIPRLGLGETRYREPQPGREMAPAAAALIEATRTEARAATEIRRSLAESFLRRIPATGTIQPIVSVPGATPGYLRLALRIPGAGALLAKSAVARRLGIAPGYPSTLGQLPALSDRLVGSRRSWPGAETLVRDLLTLPTHALLSRGDRERIIQFLAVGIGHGAEEAERSPDHVGSIVAAAQHQRATEKGPAAARPPS